MAQINLRCASVSLPFIVLFVSCLAACSSFPWNLTQKKGQTSLVSKKKDIFEAIRNDVKIAGVNEAFCDLTLQASSDRVLSKIKDPMAFAELLVPDGLKKVIFKQELSFWTKQLTSFGCGKNALKVSFKAKLKSSPPVPASFRLVFDFPSENELPLLFGEFDRHCRVTVSKSKHLLFLKHVEVYKMELRDVGEDDSDIGLMLSFGAHDIMIEVQDSGLVDFDLVLSCTGRDDVKNGVFKLASGIRVGMVRKFLHEVGVADDARSFMIAGFHRGDF